MIFDWSDPALLRCPAASTAAMAIICDSHREMMVLEGKELSAKLQMAEYWRKKWAEEVGTLSARLIEVLGEKT